MSGTCPGPQAGGAHFRTRRRCMYRKGLKEVACLKLFYNTEIYIKIIDVMENEVRQVGRC